MNQPFLVDELTEIERHIRECERHLLHQREIVEELEHHGRARTQTAKIAKDILHSFETAHSNRCSQRDRFQQALREMK